MNGLARLDSLLNFGSRNTDDIYTTRQIRQVNGLNLFYTCIALSVGLICFIFLSGARGTLVLGFIQIAATFLYLSNYFLCGFKKLGAARKLTLFIFEWHLFLVVFLTNASKSPIIMVIILFPLLAALVEESIFLHLFVGLFQLSLCMGLHFIFPSLENKILEFSNIPESISFFLQIMGYAYFPVMGSVIMKIIFSENIRARERLKEMRSREIMFAEDRKFLDNINEGLLLLNRKYIISDQYSKFTVNLLKNENIAGMNFIDLIYPDESKQDADRAELEKYLGILFINKTASSSVLWEVNPLKDRLIKIKADPDKTDDKTDMEEKNLSITFQRVFENDEVTNIMVLFEDRTDVIRKEQELKLEKIKKEREIESISAILKQGPQVFNEFIHDSHNVVDEIKFSLDIMNNNETLNHLFREVHSLKGIARALELNYLSDMFHRGEELLKNIRNGTLTEELEIKKEMLNFTGIILRELQYIEILMDKILIFHRFEKLSQPDKSRILLNNFIKTLGEMVINISKEIQKEIDFESHVSIEEFPYLSRLKGSIIHLIRNSIDHGIEDKFERMSRNKNQRGLIKFGLYRNGSNYFVEISDDGGNLDFETIRKKAVEKNILQNNDITITKKDLLNLIFSPKFSSRDHVSDISGRGVGLDIVKNEVQKLNGKISVSIREQKETKFTLIIPINKNMI